MEKVIRENKIRRLKKLEKLLMNFFIYFVMFTAIILVVYFMIIKIITGGLDYEKSNALVFVIMLGYIILFGIIFSIDEIFKNKIKKLKKEEFIDFANEKENLKDIAKISDKETIFNIISNNINKIEFGKENNVTLVAKLYIEKDFCIYPLEIPIYNFLKLLSDEEINTIVYSLLDDIKVEKESEKYKVTISDIKGNKMEKLFNIDELMNFICKK